MLLTCWCLIGSQMLRIVSYIVDCCLLPVASLLKGLRLIYGLRTDKNSSTPDIWTDVKRFKRFSTGERDGETDTIIIERANE